MRKDILKQYVLCLLAEGEFEGHASTAALAKRAMAVFATDLPLVLGELGQAAAEHEGNTIGAAVLGKVNDFIGDVARRGVGAVWADLQAQYQKGVEVKAEVAEKRKRK